MRKKHFIGLGGLLAVLGVAFVTGLLLWSGKPEADSDPRVTVDQGATATVKPQTQTYAEEFPATQNDYLGSAQRFTVFANTVNHESNILGNVAAGTINDSNGNDIKTESDMKDQLLTGTGEDAVGRDVYYYQTVTNKVPKSSDEAGMNPKMVFGQGVKGIEIKKDDSPYLVNGNTLGNIASGQLFQEPITDDAPYINIYSVLEGLRARSDALAAENQQTDLTNLVTEDDLKGNNAIFDLNNTGETDAYGDTYENAYALKLTKTSSANSDILLKGAKFALTYPLYPAHYTGSGSPDPEKWVEMMPGSDLPVTDDDGNPVYDAQGNLETHKAKLYDSEHKEIAAGTTTPYTLTTDDNGEINVSVNVSGRYQFKEIAAPSGYAMPTSVETDVTTFRTSTTPVARMFHIKWDELFATGGNGGVTGGNVYFLNVDLSKNAAPIEINIDFNTASQSEPVNVGAPNIYFIAPENSPKKSANFTQDVQNAPRMALTDAATRSKYYNKVLWNYENATDKTIDVSSDTFFGTILAPASHLILDRGKNYGSVIADQVDLNGGEIYRWDLAYQPWTSSTDNITNNRIVTNVPSTLPKTVNINFQKKWHDLVGATHSRNAITLELYQRVTDPDGTTHDSAVDDRTMTLSAKNSWQATFDSLPTRDGIGREIAYYAVEDQSDSDYTPVYNGLPVTGDQPVTVTNTQFGFDITKLATGGKTPLIGATYELTKLAADKTEAESWTLSTTAKTPTPLKVITPGTYVLKETKAPAGYQLDPKYYALKLSDKTPVVANSNYQFEEAFLDPEKVTDLETATAAAKDPANWVAIPKAAVDGFATDSDAAKTNLVHFFQSDDLLPLTVTKVAGDGTTPLADATFSWQQVGSNTEAKTYTTNDKGQLINNSGTEETANFSMQPDAIYQLQETTPPTGYKLNDTALYVKNGKLVDKDGSALTTDEAAALPASIKATDDAYALTFKDEPDAKPWQIKVVKVDADSGDQLDGASFKLAGSNDDSQSLKPTAKDGDTSSTLTMDADYTLSETTPPTGYVALDGDVTITTNKTDDPPSIKWQGNAVGEADTQTVYQKVDASAHVVTITVKDRKKGTLPSTGGTGFLKPLELAISIFIASALMFALAWWQKQKAGDAQ